MSVTYSYSGHGMAVVEECCQYLCDTTLQCRLSVCNISSPATTPRPARVSPVLCPLAGKTTDPEGGRQAGRQVATTVRFLTAVRGQDSQESTAAPTTTQYNTEMFGSHITPRTAPRIGGYFTLWAFFKSQFRNNNIYISSLKCHHNTMSLHLLVIISTCIPALS